ncbi:MAG: M6 family metalloprotease domain-containing protein [Pseudonocardia sp.]
MSDLSVPPHPSCAMPLDPRLMDRVIASRRALFAGEQLPGQPTDALLDVESLVKILARPSRTRPDTLAAPKANLAAVVGNRRVLVLLVDFADAPAQQGQQHYRDLLFSRATPPSGSMRDFFNEVSYGRLDVDGTVYGSGGPVSGWYRAPRPKSYYTDGDFGFGNHPRNAQGLVEDILELASGDVDFSGFDADGDGAVEALVLICAGSGAEQTGDKNDIWSHKWEINPQVRDGVTLARYFMAPEDGRIGVMAHELGHLLMGWPDLYDTDYSSAGTGRWDLMAAGSWNGGGDRPAHPTAWCKAKAGWVAPTTVFGDEQQITLDAYENVGHVVKLPVGRPGSVEYFLLSNRQQTGFDDTLPASGLLIEHCDDSRANNTDESHYLVDVEQADGRRDLNLNANRGDSGDLYPSGGNARFDAGSTPSSRSYSGSDSGVAVTGVARDGDRVTAHVSNILGATDEGAQWLYNQRVLATYAHHTEQFAWVNLDGLGWRRLRQGAPDGVGNLFDMCNLAVAHGRTVHVNVDSEYLYIAYLL